MVKVLFLCLGNICRSPMAEAVFRTMVKEKGLEKEIEIDSAGLGGWHTGERPHRGALDVLAKHGISHEGVISRQIERNEIQDFDYIVAMDEENIQGLTNLGAEPGPRVFRLLELVDEITDKNVPDPYFTGNFEKVYGLIARGCGRLLEKIVQERHINS